MELEDHSAGEGTAGSNNNVVVGLIDKRSEEYVETFQSFSGAGASLGSTVTASTHGVFDPSALSEPLPVDATEPNVTSIAVRLLNGKRKIVKLALNSPVAELAAHLRDDADGAAFRLVAGFPPKPMEDAAATIEAAGLNGAQVSMQKATP
jgi:UBX domain-containing protein 1